jgi:hypothetical protein
MIVMVIPVYFMSDQVSSFYDRLRRVRLVYARLGQDRSG